MPILSDDFIPENDGFFIRETIDASEALSSGPFVLPLNQLMHGKNLESASSYGQVQSVFKLSGVRPGYPYEIVLRTNYGSNVAMTVLEKTSSGIQIKNTEHLYSFPRYHRFVASEETDYWLAIEGLSGAEHDFEGLPEGR